MNTNRDLVKSLLQCHRVETVSYLVSQYTTTLDMHNNQLGSFSSSQSRHDSIQVDSVLSFSQGRDLRRVNSSSIHITRVHPSDCNQSDRNTLYHNKFSIAKIVKFQNFLSNLSVMFYVTSAYCLAWRGFTLVFFSCRLQTNIILQKICKIDSCGSQNYVEIHHSATVN